MKIIFVDSSIDNDELNPYINQDDIILPAIKRGDLYTNILTYNNINEIIIIDGVFEQCASISHKEIIWALSQGIRVIGISSMGALRAAELCSLGMKGDGVIFNQYYSGMIDGDDEVCLSYTVRKDVVYKSIPLINIRATLGFDITQRSSLFENSRRIHFKNRTWETLKKNLSSSDYEYLKLMYIDQKKIDVLNYFKNKINHENCSKCSINKSIYFKDEYIYYRYGGIINFVKRTVKINSCISFKEEDKNSSEMFKYAVAVVKYLDLDRQYFCFVLRALHEHSFYQLPKDKRNQFIKKVLIEQGLTSKDMLVSYALKKGIDMSSLAKVYTGLYKLYNYLRFTVI